MNELSLAILAGGEGLRMGVPKSQLMVGNIPILEFLLTQLNYIGPTMLVTSPGKEMPPGFSRFDKEVVDPVAGAGPVRGILTALENSQTPMLAVMTVDMPCITKTHIEWLVAQVHRAPAALGIMLSHTIDDKTQIEPFPSIFRIEAKAEIEKYFAAGGRSVYALSKRNDFVVIPAPTEWTESAWTNLNTPADLEMFLRRSV